MQRTERNDEKPQVVRKKQFGDKRMKRKMTVPGKEEETETEGMEESQSKREDRHQERIEGKRKDVGIEAKQTMENESETGNGGIHGRPQGHRNIPCHRQMISGANPGFSFWNSQVDAPCSSSRATPPKMQMNDVIPEDRKGDEVSQPHCSVKNEIAVSSGTNEISVDNEREGPNDVEPHVSPEAGPGENRTKAQPNLSLEDRKAIRSCQLICAWFLFCMIFGIPMSFMVNYADKSI